ncbi:MAG: hypothetical protein V3T49_07725, partial [Dehalococcoidia bacterium]
FEPTPIEWFEITGTSLSDGSIESFELSDGRILVHRNIGLGVPALYDPTRDEWTNIDEPSITPDGLFELSDGRVIAFGNDRTQFLDLTSGVWSEGPPLLGTDSDQSSDSPDDGRVLLAYYRVVGFDEVIDSTIDSPMNLPESARFGVVIKMNADPASLRQERQLHGTTQTVLIFDVTALPREITSSLIGDKPHTRVVQVPGSVAANSVSQIRSGFTDGAVVTVDSSDPTTESLSQPQSGSLGIEEMQLIYSWVVDDIGGLLGVFVNRSGWVQPNIGYYHPDAEEWAMFSPARAAGAGNLIALDDHQLLWIGQDDDRTNAEISAWILVMP